MNNALKNITVTKAKYVKDYILDVSFSDNTHQLISFDDMFTNKTFFKKFHIGTDGWALIWKNNDECHMLPAFSLYTSPPKISKYAKKTH